MSVHSATLPGALRMSVTDANLAALAMNSHWYVVKRKLLEQAGEEKPAKKAKKA